MNESSTNTTSFIILNRYQSLSTSWLIEFLFHFQIGLERNELFRYGFAPDTFHTDVVRFDSVGLVDL